MQRTNLIATIGTTLTVLTILAGLSAGASAQTPAGSPDTSSSPLRLTVDDAVRMALDHNVDLAAERLDPQIGDARVAAAYGVFRPTFNSGVQRNDQLQPPASFLIPTATRNDVTSSSVGLDQKLPWLGTSYSLSWTAAHTDSNSFLNSFNPILESGLSLKLSQPLFRDRAIDRARQEVAASRIDRDIADTRLRETLVHTTANVKRAYWNLVTAIANVDARKVALDLAQELVRVNKAKVDVGTAPPLDLVSAQAEVASDQEQLIIAETAVRQAEDRMRILIMNPTLRDTWTTTVEATDTPPIATPTLDVEAAVTHALENRADLLRSRKDIETAQTTVTYTANQKLPDVRLNASYQASGLGGSQVLRTGGFPGSIIGSGPGPGFGDVLSQLFGRDYPTWAVGVGVSYPIGQSVEESNYARARLERNQADERFKSAEARAILQIRRAAYQVDMNAKRIETTRAARELAEQRLDAERKRFEVGMSTSFLVIQAQRDLAQAKNNELGAVLAYDLSLVDFEALQEAGPAGQSSGGGSSNSAQAGGGAAGGSAPNPAAAAPASAASPTASLFGR
jgi:outer membrane protein